MCMATSIRVLCVDDEPDLADLVATYLMDHAEDIDALVATSGEEALAVLGEDSVDCIVCDYMMPDMDGLELLDRVREDHPDLPFILFTGRGSEDVASQAVRAGVSDYIPKSTGTEQYELLTNRVRNLVEGTRAQRSMRELFNAADDAIIVHDVDTGEIIDINEAGCTLWDVEPMEVMGRVPGELCAGDGVPDRAWLPDRLVERDRPTDWRCKRTDGSTFWAEVRMRVATIEGQERLLAVARDVTNRKRREERLSSLLTSATELVATREYEGVGEVVTETMTDTLGFKGAVFFVSPLSESTLSPVAHTGPLPDGIDVDAVQEHARIVLGGAEGRAIGDGGLAMEVPEPRSEGELMYWPVGERAVLAGYPSEEKLSGFTTDLIDLLLAITTTALIRTVQDHQLERQHEELESLNRVNEIIRDINQTLVRVATRDEIESLVCQQLATASPVVCAWIGEHDLTEEKVHVRLVAGRGADELEDQWLPTSTASEEPIAQELGTVVQERDVVVLDELTPERVGADWASMATEHGYQSLTFVPITYQNAMYDILAIYAEEPTPFGAEQQAVLRELGETIGYAMHTAERSRALLSDTCVELEYEIRDDSSLLTGLSTALETTVRLERIFFRPDDSARLFVAIEEGTLEAVEEYVRNEQPSGTEVREITEREDALVVEITVRSLPMMKHLADDMASIRSAAAENGEGRLVVEIPNTASVRTLTENLALVFDDVSLLARRQRERENRGIGDSTSPDGLGLTDRQHEVLLTAFHAGFFSWPRESTGEEIAELLDISQPTFHEHLRTGERKLLELLFEHRRSIYT